MGSGGIGIFESFLDERSKAFDFSKIISKEVEDADSVAAPSRVYKYNPFARRQFFNKPSFRFTQKSGLNDPFELTRRWNEFGSEATRALFSNHLKKTMEELRHRKDVVLTLLKHQALKREIFLDDDQLATMVNALRTKEGKRSFRNN